MGSTINRNDAISLLCKSDITKLSLQERTEQLDAMMLEDWQSIDGWSTIPRDVQKEFDNQDEIKDPANPRYDQILTLWLQNNYCGARNEYLAELLRQAGHFFDNVIGNPDLLIPCPCCGLLTLSSPGDWEICSVCWWEDDGQDNHDANKVQGGPNGCMSLTRSRINFLTTGIFDPSRKDLRKSQEPPEKYARGRTFVLSDDNHGIHEPATGWSATLSDEIE